MVNLRALAQGVLFIRDVVDAWGPFLVAVSSDPTLRDELTVEIWNEFCEPALPQLRPLPSSTVSLDAPMKDGRAMVDLLEALPFDESARRARVLDEHAILLEPLDVARSKARLSSQESEMWRLSRHEGKTIREVATQMGWSLGHAHRVRARMLTKVRAARLSHPRA